MSIIINIKWPRLMPKKSILKILFFLPKKGQFYLTSFERFNFLHNMQHLKRDLSVILIDPLCKNGNALLTVKRLLSQIRRKPLLCRICRKPLLCRICLKPLLCQIRRKPMLSQIRRKPLLCRICRKPLFCRICRKPLLCRNRRIKYEINIII